MVKELEIRAVEAIRDLLGSVPSVDVEWVEHEPEIGNDHGVDELVGFACHGGTYALVVEVRSNGSASSVPGSISSKAVWRDCAGPVRQMPDGASFQCLSAMAYVPVRDLDVPAREQVQTS